VTKEPLFRKEVVDARRNQWLGGVSLVQPLRGWIFVGLFSALALCILLFLFFGGYTQRSRVTGQLIPSGGLSTIMAPSTGIVDSVFVLEGEIVVAGQPLALVSVPRSLASGKDVSEALTDSLRRRQNGTTAESLAQNTLIRAQMDGVEMQLRLARAELYGMQEEAATRDEQVRLAQSVLQRYRTLSAEHHVSELDLKRQEQLVLEQIAERQELDRQRRSVMRTVAQLEQRLAELPAQKAAYEAAFEQELAAIEREIVDTQRGSQVLVKSPKGGLVASRVIEPGESVQLGQPLFTVLPEGTGLEAQLLVPSRSIGFIKPGDEVVLRYPTFPYQKFGHHYGTVSQVSRSSLAILQTRNDSTGNEPVYRVRVNLKDQSVMAYGKPEPLRPGMLVEADILGDSRKLYEWVLEPLYSVYGSGGMSE